MKIKLKFIDGSSMTYDKRGILLEMVDTEGRIFDVDSNADCDIVGIWYDDEKCTIPWDEVVDYKYTDFHLTSSMYLDNGQVVDEGEIVQIVVDNEEDNLVIWETSTGGEDYSGYEGDNNVYCEGCERQYEVRGVKVRKCCYCGSSDMYTKDGE